MMPKLPLKNLLKSLEEKRELREGCVCGLCGCFEPVFLGAVCSRGWLLAGMSEKTVKTQDFVVVCAVISVVAAIISVVFAWL
jgi:hypothetical protein